MKSLVLIATLFMLPLFAHSAFSQRVTRVHFSPRATKVVLTGSLTGYKGERVFLVRVRAGQRMKVSDIGHNAVSIWIAGPAGSGYEQDLAADCHGYSDIPRTAVGDYKLTVKECEKVDRWRGEFKVQVTVN